MQEKKGLKSGIRVIRKKELFYIADPDGGLFLCAVPVPGRNRTRQKILGTLFSETELSATCRANGFRFEGLPHENGALLYFRATLDSSPEGQAGAG